MDTPRNSRGWCVLYSHEYDIAEAYKECRLNEFSLLLNEFTNKDSYYMYWMADYPAYIEDPPGMLAVLNSIKDNAKK